MVTKPIIPDVWAYFQNGRCRSCDYKAKSEDDETNHIRTCPVNPHPGYVKRS